MVDIYAKPDAWSSDPSLTRPRQRFSPLVVGLSAAVVLLGVLGIGAGWVATHRERPAVGVAEEVFGDKRVTLRQYPDLPWLTYAKTYKAFLGEPQWPEQMYRGRPRCLGWRYYVICLNTDPRVQGTIWLFEPLPLGREALARLHLEFEPEASAAPLVEQYFALRIEEFRAQGERQLQGAQVIQYWFGPAISHVFCVTGPDGQGGECVQVFDKAVVRWPKDTTNPYDVYRDPLGIEVEAP